ncbi:CotO family spore coat protein [Terribacillus saccharophilus]|uniref:CotO family spore coat protein n=1 Tax=Terribacillus saccharophilus TaxID=361277 RepID=UPI0039824C20
MSKEKVRSQQPLLFIAQPELELPKAEMQQAYRTTKGKKKEVKPAEAEGKQQGEIQEGVKLHDEKQAGKENSSNKKMNFKDLTTTEKVDYFLNLPTQLPRMKCELITKDGSLIGIISGAADDIIQFKSIRRPFKREVKLEDIQDIKLLGF